MQKREREHLKEQRCQQFWGILPSILRKEDNWRGASTHWVQQQQQQWAGHLDLAPTPTPTWALAAQLLSSSLSLSRSSVLDWRPSRLASELKSCTFCFVVAWISSAHGKATMGWDEMRFALTSLNYVHVHYTLALFDYDRDIVTNDNIHSPGGFQINSILSAKKFLAKSQGILWIANFN